MNDEIKSYVKHCSENNHPIRLSYIRYLQTKEKRVHVDMYDRSMRIMKTVQDMTPDEYDKMMVMYSKLLNNEMET